MRVWSPGWEDPLEEGMAAHSSIFAWRITWTEDSGRLWSIGSQRVRHDWNDLAPTQCWFSLSNLLQSVLQTIDSSILVHLTQIHSFLRASQVVLAIKNVRDVGLILRSGRSPREGNGNPLQYSCLENTKDRGTWWVLVHRVAKSQPWLKRLNTTHTETHAQHFMVCMYHNFFIHSSVDGLLPCHNCCT